MDAAPIGVPHRWGVCGGECCAGPHGPPGLLLLYALCGTDVYELRTHGHLPTGDDIAPPRRAGVIDFLAASVYTEAVCGISSVVERKLPKLETRVRFSYPAQKLSV